jgi:cyclophilin family peptidyl-prolyl cis-trans isomerase
MSKWLPLTLLALAAFARSASADCNAPNPDERDRVEIRTPIAPVCIELLDDPNEAPLTVANFLNYVEDGDYDGSFFHRLVPGFVLQGGGFSYDPVERYEEVPDDPAVLNEPGISNLRGTVAMAKINNQPDSATNQFFINLVNNAVPLDTSNGGFTVFARVVPEDLGVVDALAALPLEYGPYAIDDALAGFFGELPMLRKLTHKKRGCVKLKSGVNPDGGPLGTETCRGDTDAFNASIDLITADLDPQVPERLVTISSVVRNPAPLCSAVPNECRAAAKASLSISEKSAGKEKLSLNLSGFSAATTQADFGNPVSGDSSYALCVYDDADALVGELAVERAQLLCGTKKLAPCWKAKATTGYGFKDAAGFSDGVRKLSAASGAQGKGKLALSASNNDAKNQIGMPTGLTEALAGATSALVQVQTGDEDCYGAELTTVKTATSTEFKATQ